MLYYTKKDAQIYILVSIKDKLLPKTFKTVQDAFVTL
jgi:hypothetical protein